MSHHPAGLRTYHQCIFVSFGPDVGFDIPLPVDYVRGVQPMLNDVGLDPNFRTVLFTIDQTVFSREIPPLAAGYPSVHAGAPWCFTAAPDASLRDRRAASATIG